MEAVETQMVPFEKGRYVIKEFFLQLCEKGQ